MLFILLLTPAIFFLIPGNNALLAAPSAANNMLSPGFSSNTTINNHGTMAQGVPYNVNHPSFAGVSYATDYNRLCDMLALARDTPDPTFATPTEMDGTPISPVAWQQQCVEMDRKVPLSNNMERTQKLKVRCWREFVHIILTYGGDKYRCYFQRRTTSCGRMKILLLDLIDSNNTSQAIVFVGELFMLFVKYFIKKEYRDNKKGDLSDPRVFAFAQYEPNYATLVLKHLFKTLRDHGYHITLSYYDKQDDSFSAYHVNVWRETSKYRPEFATKPNQADTLVNAQSLMLFDADPPLRPFENLHDFQLVFNWQLPEELALRCSEEVCVFICPYFLFY